MRGALTAGVLAGVMLAGCPASARAQGAAGKDAAQAAKKGAPAVQMGVVELAPLVDASHAQSIYRLVEGWVLDASGDIKDNTPPIRVSGTAGVRVTLRRGGFTVGVGDAYLPDLTVGAASKLMRGEDDLGPVCDLALLARIATQRAISMFGQGLAEMRAKMGNKGTSGNGQAMSEVAPLLTVDVQIARMPRAIYISPLSEEGAILQTFAPGYHGLRLIRTDAPDLIPQAWTWPGTSLAANSSPRTQLLQLLTDLKFDDTKFGLLGRNEPPPPAALAAQAAAAAATTTAPAGLAAAAARAKSELLPAVLERFEVIHIAKANPRVGEAELTRGNMLLPMSSLDEQTLRELGERLAAHLIRRIRGDGSMAGTYFPTSDTYEPAVASDEEAALATFALARWSRYLAARDSGHPQQIKTDNAILSSVNYARDRVRGNPPAGPSVAALVARTLVTAPHLSDNKGKRDEMLAVVLSHRNEDGTFRESSSLKNSGRLSVAGQALLTSAMAAVYTQNGDPKLGAQARESLELLWRDLDLTKSLAALPWLMSAEADLERMPAGAATGAVPVPGALTRAESVATVMTVLRDRQVLRAPVNGPADVVGGFEVSRPAPDVPPSPDWRSAFALDFIVRGLTFPGAIAPRDRLSWVLTAGLGARFLAQLSIDEPACYYIRSQSDAIGGVRTALWDNRLAPAPSAVSLIATADLLEALARIQETGGLGADR